MARIEAVYLESAPYVSGHERDEVDAEHATLPGCFLAEIEELLVNTDRATCWVCKSAVGFAVAVGADGEDSVQWFPTCLAREDDGPVALLCGDCSPYVPQFDAQTH